MGGGVGIREEPTSHIRDDRGVRGEYKIGSSRGEG